MGAEMGFWGCGGGREGYLIMAWLREGLLESMWAKMPLVEK